MVLFLLNSCVWQYKDGERNKPHNGSQGSSNPTRADWDFITFFVVSSILRRARSNIIFAPSHGSIRSLFTSKISTYNVRTNESWRGTSTPWRFAKKKVIPLSACCPCKASLGSWDSIDTWYKCWAPLSSPASGYGFSNRWQMLQVPLQSTANSTWW